MTTKNLAIAYCLEGREPTILKRRFISGFLHIRTHPSGWAMTTKNNLGLLLIVFEVVALLRAKKMKEAHYSKLLSLLERQKWLVIQPEFTADLIMSYRELSEGFAYVRTCIHPYILHIIYMHT